MTSAAPTPNGTREGQTFAGASRLATYASFVKLPHTVFALPFALVGVIIASYRHAVTWTMLGWVVLAFTAARFAAMGFNRIVDREYDARNPRTQMRELPRGAMSVREAWLSVAAASVVFVVAAGALNRLCLLLSPIALGWVFFYSFTKRFTRLAHVVLGLGMSIAPVGGYLAVTGRWSEPWWLLCVLATTVVTWGAGFDVLYALPDIAFDRAQGLHSIPAALGERGAIAVSRGLHAITLLSLALVGFGAYQGDATASVLYWTGVLVVAALLAYEHSLVRPGDLSKLDAAFFTMNGIISLLLFGFVLAGRLYVTYSAMPHGVR
ncbi:MAG: 4-hydroxybenzoate octaprenyltransferase [Gemmatimonadetes bacterium]|nr:MAG: 4-hydroxybenzoate octaprenyltransferase [Gemmatimonadota bacterium]